MIPKEVCQDARQDAGQDAGQDARQDGWGGKAAPPLDVGVDVGATLAKLAIRPSSDAGSRGGAIESQKPMRTARFEILPADDLRAVALRVEALKPTQVGLTGGGALALAEQLSGESTSVNEFAAWGSGAALLLEASRSDVNQPYLLVSLGTGTSALLVDGTSVRRTGGTALGGGTLMGLGAALVGDVDFAELCLLAERGRRSAVDLVISDIYGKGEFPLSADITASAFGKLARLHRSARGSIDIPREDLAAGVMGLVGENVGLICNGLAAAAEVGEIVFAGSTLRTNPVLVSVLGGVIKALGRRATFLADGEFAGALGGLELARVRD